MGGAGLAQFDPRVIEGARADAERLFALIHPQDAVTVRAAIARSAETLEPFEEVARLATVRGYRWIRARSVPGLVPAGILWNGVLVDVDDEVRLQEGLRRAQRREALGELAAGIAHNFNNLLAVILPALEEARDEAPQDLRESLDDALKAGWGSRELVRQLMTLGREAPEEHRAAFDLSRAVDGVITLCRRVFPATVRIDAELPPGVRVAGAPTELQQVVLNLALNARDALAGQHGLVRVVVGTRPASEDDGGPMATLRVDDDGPGMSEATLLRLGEPFFTTKPEGKGTGLGLASVFQTVERLGGRIEITSSPGQGASFLVRLPLAGVGELAPRVTQFAGTRVMVAVADPELRHATCAALVDRNAVVREVSSRDELSALLVLEPAGWDAIVMDATSSAGRIPQGIAVVPVGIDVEALVVSLHEALERRAR